MNKKAAAVAALVFLAGLLLFWARIHYEMADFTVNYTAGGRMLRGETLYRAEDGHYQFKYPPFAALLYLPLALLPLTAAKTVWFVLVLGASIAAFFLALKLSRGRGLAPVWFAWIPALVLARYFFREWQLGQINALMTFLLLAMTFLLVVSEGRRAAGAEAGAGVLWAVSVALKPYALIFLPYWFVRRKFRLLAASAVSLVAAFLVPALYYGWPGNWTVHREWIRSLSRSTPQLLNSQDNVSLLGLFNKWTGRADLAFWLWVVALIMLAGLMLYVVRAGRRLENPVTLECGILLLLIPLVSPLGWDYTFLSSVLALTLISRHFLSFSPTARTVLAAVFLLIALSLYDLLGRRLYARFMSLSIITLCFLTLAGYAVALRKKQLC